MNGKIDSLGYKSTRGPMIISLLLSIPIFLLAAFVFTTPPEQIKDQTSNGSLETSTRGTIQRIDSEDQNSVLPFLAQSNDNVYVAWQDNSSGTSEIYFRGSEKNGSSFRGIRNLSNNTGSSEFPQIAATGDNVYVAWQDDTNSTSGNSDIQFKAGSTNGSKFRGTRNLSNNTGSSEFPQIAAAGDNAYVVWQDNSTGNNDIFFKRSTNNGSGFSGTRNLSNNTGNSELPQIAAAGDNAYVVWQDNSTENNDIFFKRSTNNGLGFSGTRNLSNNTGNSELPQISAAGDNAYVVWQDNSTGNSAIYFIEVK